MGNSFTSVIESSESSLYNADERRSSSRLGILPLSPLVDDGEDHPLTSSNAAEVFSDHSRRSTVVRIVTGDSDSEDKALMSERSTHHPTYPIGHHNKLGMGNLGGGYERSTPSDFRGLSTFHLYLCCGMMGFVIFWVVLMLRIYLPESYWRWSYFWWWKKINNDCKIQGIYIQRNDYIHKSFMINVFPKVRTEALFLTCPMPLWMAAAEELFLMIIKPNIF